MDRVAFWLRVCKCTCHAQHHVFYINISNLIQQHKLKMTFFQQQSSPKLHVWFILLFKENAVYELEYINVRPY